MSKGLSEYLQQSALKIISQQKTRHQTSTKKKIYLQTSSRKSQPLSPSPFIQRINQIKYYKPKPRYSYLRDSLIVLQSKKTSLMNAGKYRSALMIDKSITRARSELNKAEIKRLENRIMNQSKLIEKSYKNEKLMLKRAWKSFSLKVQEQEISKISNFYQEKSKIEEQACRTIFRKSRSLRNKSKQLIILQKQHQYYLMKNDIRHVSLVKKQIKQVKQKVKKEKENMIERWTQKEQKLICTIQAKKYSILMKNIEEKKIDQEIIYYQQKKRLKQKYKNILSQLKHQQRMTLNFVNRRIETSLYDQNV